MTTSAGDEQADTKSEVVAPSEAIAAESHSSESTSSTRPTPWPSRESDLVTPSLATFAAWSWRFLLVVAAIWVFATIVGFLSTVTIPIAIALLLAALLSPVKNMLVKRGMSNELASPLVFVGGLIVVIGLITLIVQQFVAGAPRLAAQSGGGLDEIRAWLNSTFQITDSQLSGWFEQAKTWLSDNSEQLTSGALATATTAGHALAGFVLALFTLFFFLKDGPAIWGWVLRFVPNQSMAAVDGAANRAWVTLGGYVKATAAVAFVDAIGIGIGLVIIGVPLALPLAALVFLASFIPLVGAILSGAIAALVALVTVGAVKALIVVAVVIGVQQLESHVLQPILMGRAVQIHPLGIVLAIAIGSITAGIIGTLLAVPLAAALNAAFSYLYGKPEAEVNYSQLPNEVASEPPTTA